MPNTTTRVLGAGYESDPIREYAEAFGKTVNNIVRESKIDYYHDTVNALQDPAIVKTLQNFFVKESYDPNSMTARDQEAVMENTTQLFKNDVRAIMENTGLGALNPVIGMALPMHKNIMMNMVWDKGGIPKKVVDSPKIVRTMEVRKLVKPDGTEIDMYTQQNLMTDAMLNVNPWVNIELQSGEAGETEIVHAKLNGVELIDHIDVESYIAAVKVEKVAYTKGMTLPDEDGFVPAKGGEVHTGEDIVEKDTWIPVRLKFGPGYGEVKRQLMRKIKFDVNKKAAAGDTVETVTVEDIISASIINDRFIVSSMKGAVSSIMVRAKLDASSRTIETPTVKWEEIEDITEIGTDPGISVTISPEELRDVNALYNINQTTKLMALMKTALGNRKDDMIKRSMDESYERLAENCKFYGIFDYAPRQGYVSDQIEWRSKTFFDYFDSAVTQMLRVLNDPNMTVAVYGEPDIIRKITPKTYTYQAPAQIGAVELDFSKTVVTSDKRVYSFIGSDKLRNNYELIMTLCPRNTNRIVYVIYDYQYYISNEIRNNANPALPQITTFERWLFDEYQPVQGRIQIVNPTGLKDDETATRTFA